MSKCSLPPLWSNNIRFFSTVQQKSWKKLNEELVLCRIYFRKNSCYCKNHLFFLILFQKFTNRFFFTNLLGMKSSKSFQICQEFAQYLLHWYIASARNTNRLNLCLGHLMRKNHYFVFQICKWQKIDTNQRNRIMIDAFVFDFFSICFVSK